MARHKYLVLHVDGGRVVGATGINEPRELKYAQKLIEARVVREPAAARRSRLQPQDGCRAPEADCAGGESMFDVLRDIRVLDFGKFVAAPSATWLLSNFGADVLKIEPVGGSPDREPFRISDDLDGAGFLQLHSNKRSLCLDHESAAGRAVLDKLLAKTDVVVLGAPASTLARQRLDYETLVARQSTADLSQRFGVHEHGAARQRHRLRRCRPGHVGRGLHVGFRRHANAVVLLVRRRHDGHLLRIRDRLRTDGSTADRQGPLRRNVADDERLRSHELAAGRAGGDATQPDTQRQPRPIVGPERHLPHARWLDRRPGARQRHVRQGGPARRSPGVDRRSTLRDRQRSSGEWRVAERRCRRLVSRADQRRCAGGAAQPSPARRPGLFAAGSAR